MKATLFQSGADVAWEMILTFKWRRVTLRCLWEQNNAPAQRGMWVKGGWASYLCKMNSPKFLYIAFLKVFAEREMSFMLTFLQMLSNTRFGRSRRNSKFLEEQKCWLKKKWVHFFKRISSMTFFRIRHSKRHHESSPHAKILFLVS